MNETSLLDELRQARRTLNALRMQAATHGIMTPPAVSIQIEDTEQLVAQLEMALGLERTEPRQLPPSPRKDYAAAEERRRQAARQDDIEHQLTLLGIHRRNLSVLRAQAEAHGGWKFAPMHVKNQMTDAQASIAQVKRALDALGGVYDNLPGDE